VGLQVQLVHKGLKETQVRKVLLDLQVQPVHRDQKVIQELIVLYPVHKVQLEQQVRRVQKVIQELKDHLEVVVEAR
jgi:CRISPR/Cas system CSM-associated protein Csm2 small subunit